MSIQKPFIKGTVAKGELVFDQNFNPLHSNKNPKKISLQSYIAINRSKVLEHNGYQGSPQFRIQANSPLPPSNHAYSRPFTKAPSNDNVTLSTRNAYRQPANSGAPPSKYMDITQDELSEAMDTSSDHDNDNDSNSRDDMSENMDMSSGPEAYDLSDEDGQSVTAGATASTAILVKSEPETDDMSDNIFLRKAHPAPPKPLTLNSQVGAYATSDATSATPRMSSTPSGVSGPSSNTSAGLSNMNDPAEETGNLFGSSKSPMRCLSLSSELSPAKSTTPPALKPVKSPQKSTQRRTVPRQKKLRFSDLRPRTSIPANLAPQVLAQQGIHAAYSSRLNPFGLHPNEYQLLRNHICHLHVSSYLNIRNRILRLWVRNPLVSVTAEEAAGCAMSSRWLGLAEVAYEWLVRRGYINFGCVEPPDMSNAVVRRYRPKRYRRKTVAIIGAGMSGLGCARQLEGLFEHYRERWTSKGEEPPKVVLLEGRNRIGGRVYSHPLRDQRTTGIPEQKRSTAELGAHIIIGFDHGNPLNMIVRGQLALNYHALKDNSTLHDVDGYVVDEDRDSMVEKLYNDCLDRASVYRYRNTPQTTVDGDKALIETGRDPSQEGGPSISAVEDAMPSPNTAIKISTVESCPGGMDKFTGKAHMITGPRKKQPPARAAEGMGWKLSSDVLAYHDLNLDVVAKTSDHPTLGAAMDEAVKQYQFLLDLSPQDMRLLNWHYANLEYANAANVGKLSLGGWDQDAGNEFEGVHAQVIGGYQQVPRAILHSPSKLDLRTRKIVKSITYESNKNLTTKGTRIVCDDGEVFEADHIVLTTSLGVLKSDAIQFEPQLPEWKRGPIERLGFGTLNKVILVYEQPFWDVKQDMFGLLREPEVKDSLDQEDYIANRGRFYFFWNCIKTTGRPVLISLMAGDAAHQAESTSDTDLVNEVTGELAKIFGSETPKPLETIITRWGKDRFALGSYSYVGATSQPGDYEALAAPVGTLHFAGEATCATHPATVHGAYISGLRAATEVIDDLIGPIEIPRPLVSWPTQSEHDVLQTPQRPAPVQSPSLELSGLLEPATPVEPEDVKQARLEAFENEILNAIYAELGLRPSPPGKPGSNPFLLFTTDVWAETKKSCDEARVAATGNPASKASRHEVRATIGQKWRTAPEEQKKPYLEKTENNRRVNEEQAATFDARLASWDEQAMEVRRRYVREHGGILSEQEEQDMWRALGVPGNGVEVSEERKAKKLSGYADRDPDVGL